MMFNGTLFELGLDIIPDIISVDVNTDIVGDWINLENADRAYLVLMKPAGTAGDDLSIRLQQALTAVGGSAKALTFTKLWHKIGVQSAVGQWTAVTLATATDDLDLVSVNGADLAADDVAATFIVEVRASSLDVNNLFKFINVLYEGDDVGNATVITSFWILAGTKYPQAIPPTALA